MTNAQTDTKSTFITASFNTIANIIAMIVGIIAMPIITRIMSQEDLGLAATFIANRNIIVIIIMLGIYYYVNRAMLEFPTERINYIYTISLFCIAVTLLAFIISLPFKAELQEWLFLDDFLYYWFFVSILVYSLYSLAYYYCYFNNYTKLVSAMTLSLGPVSQIFSIIIVFLMTSDQYLGRVISLDFVYVVISMILMIWLATKIHSLHPKMKFIIASLKVTIPLIPYSASQTALSQLDLIMIASLIGAAESGIYAMGHTIGFLAYTILAQIMASWSPWFYRRVNEKDYETVHDLFPVIMVLGIILSLGLIAISPEAVLIFLPASYCMTVFVIPPLVAAFFFQFCYLFIYDVEYFYKKTGRVAVCSVIVVIVNIILNLLFIPMFGFVAACYTTLFSYFISFVLNFIFAYPLGIRPIYGLRLFLISTIAVVSFLIMDLLFIDFLFIRYALFLAYGLLFILPFRKKIALLLSTLKQN